MKKSVDSPLGCPKKVRPEGVVVYTVLTIGYELPLFVTNTFAKLCYSHSKSGFMRLGASQSVP